MPKIKVSFHLLLVVAMILPSTSLWAQDVQLSDSQVPHVIVKDRGVHNLGQILVAIHDNEKYDGLTFRWCPPVNGVVDCKITYSYLGCRKAGDIYTLQELKHEQEILKWWQGGRSIAYDAAIIAAVIIVGSYAARSTAQVKKAAEAAETAAKKLPDANDVKQIGNNLVNELGPILTRLKNQLTIVTGLSAFGISVPLIISHLTKSLNPEGYFKEAQLLSFDLYKNANAKQVDVARDLNESVDQLNSILCSIDGE